MSPVLAKNLRGHRGIIKHTVTSSDDEGYNNLIVPDIEANILDNDGNYGWLCVVDQGELHFITEDGDESFSFFVYPTVIPNDDLFVNVVAPTVGDEQPYVLINDNIMGILSWSEGQMDPREVKVSYNTNATKLDNTEIKLMLKSFVDLDSGKTKDSRFVNSGKDNISYIFSLPLTVSSKQVIC